MRSSNKKSHAICIALGIALGTLGVSNVLWATTPPEMARLESCMAQAIAIEAQQSNPNIDNVLTACQVEMNTLLAILPAGSETAIQEKILHSAQHKLDAS